MTWVSANDFMPWVGKNIRSSDDLTLNQKLVVTFKLLYAWKHLLPIRHSKVILKYKKCVWLNGKYFQVKLFLSI